MSKKLQELRNDKIAEMQALIESAKTENRAFSADEKTKFDTLEAEIKVIDDTIAAEERARNLEKTSSSSTKTDDKEKAEERAFLNYINGVIEQRAGEQNLDMTNNTAIIPTSIAKRVITKVEEQCPIFRGATRFNVKGTLKIPVWGNAGAGADQNITVAYQDEFTDITANSGKFTSVDLTGYLAGALTLIGKSVINNGDVDVLNFIVNQMAKDIAAFIEKECLNGTSLKVTGALSTSTTLNAGSVSAISADNLIDLQCKIPTVYQTNACWTMHPNTFAALKKLKDGNGQYLLQSDFSGAMPYRILGKPVYLSDNMPTIGSANKAVLYGDYSGLAINFRENISIEVLREKYATQHAVGVVSWFEFDAKVMDNQRLAALVMSAAG